MISNQPPAGSIDILTVSYNVAELVLLQQVLMTKLCSGKTKIVWHVVDTSPNRRDEKLLRNVSDLILYESEIQERCANFSPADVSPRSYQHAMALNFLLDKVSGPDILIVDPDCFIVTSNWDEKLLKARTERRTIIGAPYHPSRWYKYGRGFPTPTLMFTSLPELLSLDVDFYPGKYPNFSSLPFRLRPLQFLKYGTWRDTGWHVIRRARKSRWRFVSLDAPLLRPGLEPRGVWRNLRKFVPQRFLALPRHLFCRPDEGLITEAELSGAPGGALYEEYYLNRELFACHLRGASQRGLQFDSVEARFWVDRIVEYATRQQNRLGDRTVTTWETSA